jgi:hypothetical protein
VKRNQKRKKEKFGLEIGWIKRNMEQQNKLLKLRDNSPLKFKSVIRLTTEQFEELLLMISPIISHNGTLRCPALLLKLEITLV